MKNMKIDLLSIDRESFMVHPHILNDEVVHLVQPTHIACKWTRANKHFRSSLWDDNGELISAGFPKFTNYGENPDHFPVPDSLSKCVCVEKLDGSLLIVSKWKGNYILRTRGTVDAHKLDNGYELEIFEKTILPKLDESARYYDGWLSSFLFEWLSPDNRVVIRVEEPQFKLVGIVCHLDYMLATQGVLDDYAKENGLDRPDTYSFDSISDLLQLVEKWEGKEGVVIYSNKGQTLHKIKSEWYLKLHAFKSLASFENTIELFFQYDMPSYLDFEKKLVEQFDYECFSLVRGFASVVCEGYKEVQKIVSSMTKFADSLKSLPNRKEQALVVFSSYGKESNRSSFIFSILDGKPLSKEQLKKLIYQVTKK
jgi:hypothetical protein